MADEPLPFKLIARPPADIETHRAAEKHALLAKRTLPQFLSSHQQSALRYQPTKDLLLAINMALHTGSPLLLTGEPGTGKTQAADFVGAYFGITVYKFLVKSISTAQDLLYEFDAVGYLHWAQASDRQPAVQAQPGLDALTTETEAVRNKFLRKNALWQAYETDGDCVVLIDEIDKAPRDFPNDLLHELDQHSFPHPFDQTRMIRPQSERPPIIIVTSNEERRLPDAFLRRCIFHHINLTPELVEAAVESMARAAGAEGDAAFPHLDAATRAAARQRFWDIRNLPQIDKKPSTAELLTWLCILSAQRVEAETLRSTALSNLPGIGVLIKNREDVERLG